MTNSIVDRWLGLALIALAVAWVWLARTYIPDLGGEWPGPRGFPILLGVILALLGVALAGPRRATRPTYHVAEAIPPVTRRELTVAGGTFGLLILYAFLLDTLGFVVATPVVIALALSSLLGMRGWGLTVALAVGFTAGCWVIFDALLGTPLPGGTPSWIPW